MKKKTIRYYCVSTLPFWLYVIDRDYTLKILLLWLIWDVFSILLSLLFVRAERPLQILKKALPAVYLARSLIWLVGMFFMTLPVLLAPLFHSVLPTTIADALYTFEPNRSIFTFCYCLAVTLGCGYVLKHLYHSILTWKLPLNQEQEKRFSLLMAIFGTPILFLFGSCLPFLH